MLLPLLWAWVGKHEHRQPNVQEFFCNHILGGFQCQTLNSKNGDESLHSKIELGARGKLCLTHTPSSDLIPGIYESA